MLYYSGVGGIWVAGEFCLVYYDYAVLCCAVLCCAVFMRGCVRNLGEAGRALLVRPYWVFGVTRRSDKWAGSSCSAC